MLFNSNEFLAFFCFVFLLYFLLSPSLKAQNYLIFLASCLFYGSWSPLFLLLMIFTASMDYLLGFWISKTQKQFHRKALLIFSLVLNLGILGYFKYSVFVLEALGDLFDFSGSTARASLWTVVLPLGISFYTFQSISYVIDVYRRRIEPETNWIRFMAFVTYFPQLVAGPIERAGHLLPQFRKERRHSMADVDEGTWLLLWGFFKKVVIADNLAPYSDLVFSHDMFPLSTYYLGSIAFGLQIYCDFSGYSDIARGLGKFFGFDLMFNFRMPYFALSLRDFWNRWHISLSNWFRDYLYIPLGGNRGSTVRTCFNLFAVMVIAGLWHGANWTFILWGAWHGMALAVNFWWRQAGFVFPRIFSWLLTAGVVVFGWLFFRAESLAQLYAMFFQNGNAPLPMWTGDYLQGVFILMVPLVVVETVQIWRKNLIWPTLLPFAAKSLLYGFLAALILLFWEKEGTSFIYFQF